MHPSEPAHSLDGNYKEVYNKGGKFSVYYPESDEELTKVLRSKNVEVKVNPQKETVWWSIALNFLPFIFLLIVIGVPIGILITLIVIAKRLKDISEKKQG